MQIRSPLELTRSEEVRLDRPEELRDDFVLSPYAWREPDGSVAMLVRVVNRSDDPSQKVARIYAATSDDGEQFVLAAAPAIAPGAPGLDDDGGCEDPTVVRASDGAYHVYYSGYARTTGSSRMLYASGHRLDALHKRGRVLPPDPAYENSKEATVVRAKDGYVMLFEYSAEGASKIGFAEAASLEGPWSYRASPLTARVDRFDAWHLSPGPVLRTTSDEPIVIYNGATRDAHWRIGWAVFDRNLCEVRGRCNEPLIEPGDVEGDATDIAFAASAIEDDARAHLYYSVSDARLMRAELELT